MKDRFADNHRLYLTTLRLMALASGVMLLYATVVVSDTLPTSVVSIALLALLAVPGLLLCALAVSRVPVSTARMDDGALVVLAGSRTDRLEPGEVRLIHRVEPYWLAFQLLRSGFEMELPGHRGLMIVTSRRRLGLRVSYVVTGSAAYSLASEAEQAGFAVNMSRRS